MSSSQVSHARHVAALATEAGAMVERLRLISLEALAGVRDGDLSVTSHLARERESLIRRATPLLEQIHVQRDRHPRGSDPASERAMESEIRALQLKLHGARTAEMGLLQEITGRRDAIAQEIEALVREPGPAARYLSAESKPGHAIDLRR